MTLNVEVRVIVTVALGWDVEVAVEGNPMTVKEPERFH